MSGLEVAASAVSFLEAADICIKVARKLIHRIQAYRHANTLIAELVIRVEAIWVKTETQVVSLSKVRDYQNERLREFHETCLRTLVAKLNAANAELDPFVMQQEADTSLSSLVIEHGPVKRIRYSLLEGSLKRTILNLESWQKTFDPSWFLLTLSVNDEVSTTLADQSNGSQRPSELQILLDVRQAIQESTTQSRVSGAIFRDSTFTGPSETSVPNSELVISHLSESNEPVIINTTAYPPGTDLQPVNLHVRNLARVLSCSQPDTFGLLKCRGVIKHSNETSNESQFRYVFSLPNTSTPSSLRALLLNESLSLDAKYNIAKFITRGVLAVHCADFVHKNIRPDNIVVFGSDDQNVHSYLVGFEHSRPAGSTTNFSGDMLWHKNVYRHPRRQGIRPQEAYIMQHDIYSLGVCLLEIGIWSPLVLPSEDPQPGPKFPIGHLLNTTDLRNPMQVAWKVKIILVEMAEKLLPSLMGITYTEIVISCLTCLDSDATNMFADEKDLLDEDGILVGVIFIEKILTKLHSISI